MAGSLEDKIALAAAKMMISKRNSDRADIIGLAEASEDLAETYRQSSDQDMARTHANLAKAYRSLAQQSVTGLGSESNNLT